MSAPVPDACVCSSDRLQPRRRELRLRLLERDPERRRVDPEQQVAALHLAAVPDAAPRSTGPATCGLTETMSCFTCASSVDTLPPLVSQ